MISQAKQKTKTSIKSKKDKKQKSHQVKRDKQKSQDYNPITTRVNAIPVTERQKIIICYLES